ncbi:TPA: hypothetical protein EYN09_12765 [Candidatus Poribacteria bacterium]|nr:hypothetical protein [Candidatus Poribacteria bacterium]HIO07775.1 hypothetical protein [Candidatus Poribacteria bacterium]
MLSRKESAMPTQNNSSTKPVIFEQSRLGYVDIDAIDLPRTNAESKPVIELTPEQRYLFDTQGWLLIPGLLSEDEVDQMRAFCYRIHQQPESLPEAQRCTIAGPLEQLTDHPFIVGFMNEFLAHPDLSSQDCYGFRMESSSLTIRSTGEGTVGPHNGHGLMRLPGDSHNYRCIPGQARSSLTCVVWELNEVEYGCGGTLLISGSHKATYLAPESVQNPNSPLWVTYGCPAGSLLIFAESTTHSASPWKSAERDRVAIFSRYNYVNSKWHKWEPHPELLESFPPKRRTLFRPVHVEGNLVSPV